MRVLMRVGNKGLIMSAKAFFNEVRESAKGLDVNNLDFRNPGVLPLVVKLVLWVAIAVAVVALGFYMLLTPKQQELEAARAQETNLKKNYQEKAAKAANLDAYRKQMVEMEALFKALVSQLPSDTEVPGLLEDISQFGEKSGLKINALNLQPEQQREIFIELPINLNLSGAYHDLGSFVSAVAGLPRIVTLHDFKVATNSKSGQAVSQVGQLEVTMLAKTYRFRKQEE